ncbi:MAG: acyl--CoA ligase [Deltaproteobacteria bacterium]|nr:acyl--CoA ligase [Deltaproteobacteria bacterium]MBW2063930.1 acyl--CoA ligase [Deltaproteobacteria bacterium]
MSTIEDILQVTRENSRRTFVVDAISDRSYSYHDVQDFALRLCRVLKENGVESGDRIGVLLDNSVEFVISYFSCLYMGALAVPVSVDLNSKTIGYIVKTVAAKLLICSSRTLSKVEGIRGIDRVTILCLVAERERFPKASGISYSLRLSDLLQSSIRPLSPFCGVDERDYFTITFTSGSTSKPKGVFHPIRNYITAARMFNESLQVERKDRFYHILPMAYMAGLLNLIICPYMAGASIVVGRSFDALLAIEFWKAARKHGVNRMWLVPSIMAILMKVDRDAEGREYCRNKIRDAFVGTAPLQQRLKRDFERKYGIAIYESYGLSETMFVTSNRPGDKGGNGSVGYPMEGISIRIMREKTGHSGKVRKGEVWVRTPTMMTGYLNEATGAPELIDQDEYFPTGDLGYVDVEGRLHIVDRKKDIIIKAGINISPRAIEETVERHSAVEQAAAIGIPHELYGEDVAVALILKRGAAFQEVLNSIKQLCKERLDLASVPSYYFQFEEFPLSFTGKVKKRELRELLLLRMRGK